MKRFQSQRRVHSESLEEALPNETYEMGENF